MYFTNVGGKGPVRYGQCPLAIGVTESRDSPVLVGAAHCIGRTDRGFALWRLVVRGRVSPGRWIIFNRRFLKVQ
jgi:hypothetical protein